MFLFSCSVNAQEKVLDKSLKKAPPWVNTMENNYLIGFSSSAELNDAQLNALNHIKEQIVNSIAVNVNTNYSILDLETFKNNDFNHFSEFSSQISISSVNVPYLKGISLSKAADFYWEKVKNTSNNEVFFRYYIKYPFSNHDLNLLIREFKERDRSFEMKLDEIITNIDSFSTLEQLDNYVKELEILGEYFVDSRSIKVNLAIQKCISIFSNIEYVLNNNKLGVIDFSLRYGKREIAISKAPKFISGCATLSKFTWGSSGNVIEYDFDDCLPNYHNDIYLSYTLNKVELKKKMRVPFDNLSFKVSDPILLELFPISNEKELNISLILISNSDIEFIIENLYLQINYFKSINILKVNQKINGKGRHVLMFKTKISSDIHDLLLKRQESFPLIDVLLDVKINDSNILNAHSFSNIGFSISVRN